MNTRIQKQLAGSMVAVTPILGVTSQAGNPLVQTIYTADPAPMIMFDIYGLRPPNFGFRETTDFKTFTDLGRFNEGVMKATNSSSPTLGLQWTAWRDYAGIQLKDGSLFLNAKGSGPRDARLLLVTATDAAYETQVEVTVPSGGSGGLILFYNEKAFAGLTSDGKEFMIYRDAAKVTREPNSFGSHFFLKIVNRQDRCALLASADGKTWTGLLDDVDVSGLQHNRFAGFLALRPGLMAAGGGEVRFERFVYTKP